MQEILELAASLLLKLIFAALGALISAYIIPYLKEKKLYGLLTKLVSAAEKLAQCSTIPKEEKKNYVISRLCEYGVKVTPFVDALIEAAVLELDLVLRGGNGTSPTDEIENDTVGETATPHPKDASHYPKDASPHPSLPTANPPSPEGEGANRLLPWEKLSAELTDEGVEERTSDARPYEQNCNDTVGADATSARNTR